MGEKKRKIDADACGIPRPRDERCPACGSHKIVTVPASVLPDGVDSRCEWQVCRACGAFWEPFPPVYVCDPACAEPCDNCAFRPGSPEQADKEKWKSLIDSLKPDLSYGHFTGRFYCHKGVPIDMTKGPGNFLFPQTPVLMDGKPVIGEDGKPVLTEDARKMRVCSGFLRMFWAQAAKASTQTDP
jgi:hypothetical protein